MINIVITFMRKLFYIIFTLQPQTLKPCLKWPTCTFEHLTILISVLKTPVSILFSISLCTLRLHVENSFPLPFQDFIYTVVSVLTGIIFFKHCNKRFRSVLYLYDKKKTRVSLSGNTKVIGKNTFCFSYFAIILCSSWCSCSSSFCRITLKMGISKLRYWATCETGH